MKLFKSLKSALSARQEVTHLKLTLKGEFPGEILSLSELRELYLDGDSPSIPDLSSLAHLELLSLSGTGMESNVSALLKLPRLKNLKLIGMELSDISVQGVSELSPLVSLTIKSCALTELPASIGRFGLITEMNLDGNALSDLPREFKNLSFLKRLNLDHNRFERFPSVLGEIPSLKHLSLDGNLFDEDEKARIQRQHHLTIH